MLFFSGIFNQAPYTETSTFSQYESIPKYHDLELMQFTGLLDKKGKEIYEGDVVVQDGYIWFDEGEPNYIGTVEWVFSQWQVIAHCVNQHKQGISDGINYGLNDEGWEDGKKTTWEVIGNIYEGFPEQETT